MPDMGGCWGFSNGAARRSLAIAADGRLCRRSAPKACSPSKVAWGYVIEPSCSSPRLKTLVSRGHLSSRTSCCTWYVNARG